MTRKDRMEVVMLVSAMVTEDQHLFDVALEGMHPSLVGEAIAVTRTVRVIADETGHTAACTWARMLRETPELTGR